MRTARLRSGRGPLPDVGEILKDRRQKTEKTLTTERRGLTRILIFELIDFQTCLARHQGSLGQSPRGAKYDENYLLLILLIGQKDFTEEAFRQRTDASRAGLYIKALRLPTARPG